MSNRKGAFKNKYKYPPRVMGANTAIQSIPTNLNKEPVIEEDTPIIAEKQEAINKQEITLQSKEVETEEVETEEVETEEVETEEVETEEVETEEVETEEVETEEVETEEVETGEVETEEVETEEAETEEAETEEVEIGEVETEEVETEEVETEEDNDIYKETNLDKDSSEAITYENDRGTYWDDPLVTIEKLCSIYENSKKYKNK